MKKSIAICLITAMTMMVFAPVFAFAYQAEEYDDYYYDDYYEDYEGEPDAEAPGDEYYTSPGEVIVEAITPIDYTPIAFDPVDIADPITESHETNNSANLVDLVLTLDSTIATVGGETKTLDVAPFLHADRTMVPFRFIGEMLGAEVDWNPETSTAYFIDNDFVLSLTIGERLYDQNGEYMGTPIIEDGRTVVPVRFVSQSMGANVIWNGDARTVTIPVPLGLGY